MEFGRNLSKSAWAYAYASTAKTLKYLVTRFLYPFLFFTQRLVLCKSYIPIDLDRIYIVPSNLPRSLFAPSQQVGIIRRGAEGSIYIKGGTKAPCHGMNIIGVMARTTASKTKLKRMLYYEDIKLKRRRRSIYRRQRRVIYALRHRVFSRSYTIYGTEQRYFIYLLLFNYLLLIIYYHYNQN